MQGMEPLYRAWNCGYRVVASAGEDAFPNFYRSYIIGSNRVYVRTGKALDYDKWTNDFRAGRSFVTSGPLVFLKVNGKEPGDEIRLAEGTHTLSVEVEVKSIMPILDVEVLWKGKPIKTMKAEQGQRKLSFTMPAEVTGSGWFGVQTRAQYGRTPVRRPFPFAATMPVWVISGDKPVRSPEDANFFVQWMEKSLARAMQETAWNNDQERDETRRLYEEAKARMLKRRE
jgi:TolB protein